MRILIDTDVLLDVALGRSEFVKASADVLRWAESGGKAVIAWHSISNCAYLLKGDGRQFLGSLLTIVEVAATGTKVARKALELPMKDLEDAMQAAAALSWKADFIITRNVSDYRKSPVPAVTPNKFLKELKAS
jgi:predicted nucleic acid-binding protein